MQINVFHKIQILKEIVRLDLKNYFKKFSHRKPVKTKITLILKN